MGVLFLRSAAYIKQYTLQTKQISFKFFVKNNTNRKYGRQLCLQLVLWMYHLRELLLLHSLNDHQFPTGTGGTHARLCQGSWGQASSCWWMGTRRKTARKTDCAWAIDGWP